MISRLFDYPVVDHARESNLARIGIATIGVYLLDDAFFRPEPGVTASAHLVSGTIPVLVLALVAFLYPRLPRNVRVVSALALGLLAFGAGMAVPVLHSLTEGPTGDDYTGLVATLGGLLLIIVSVKVLWQSRRTDERRRRRYTRRLLTGMAGLIVVVEIIAPIGMGFVMTHQPRRGVSAADLGAPYEEVTLETRDGLKLAGWYVPSRNGAAVLVFPGRTGPRGHARMLIRHGYGVLMLDRRGNGASEGDGVVPGWNGEEDVLAALEFLGSRPDVRDGQIGGLGLSVGGELLLQTAAHTDALRAVVSEGAGARSVREQIHGEPELVWTMLPHFAMTTLAVALFANETPPPYLGDLVGRIAPRPVFLIYSTNGQGGEHLTPKYAAATGDPKQVWAITDAGHTEGLSAHPEEYERRVIAFFDQALLGVEAKGTPPGSF